ncbi:MAG: nucleotidyltransferase [Armatimonadetes bacterium]|nr:nucleotidyltransferase [Armatimonadota bacterium]
MDRLTSSLEAAQRRLAEADIDTAAIGALAVAAWGEPRLTRDVDLKVLLSREEAPRLAEVLAGAYEAPGVEPREALEHSGMLFTRDSLGTRIDFLLSDTEFDRQAVQRGVEVSLAGVSVKVCRPEDLIVYKLLSTRPRDHADAETVIQRQGDGLDCEHIRHWLRLFEQALNDSTLISTFDRLYRDHVG